MSSLFSPGVFSVDSFYFYSEAVHGTFSDAHALLLPAILHLLLKAGGSVSVLTLVQCVAGFFGLRRLALAVSSRLDAGDRTADNTATGVVLVFAFPLTPLSIHLATLWTDTWLLILLLWFVALILEIRPNETNSGVPSWAWHRLAPASVLFGFILLVRDNTFFIFPAYLVLLSQVVPAGRSRRLAVVLLALAPILLYVALIHVMKATLRPEPLHDERVVYALDLASMYVQRPVLCEVQPRPVTCELVLGRFRSEFVPGRGAIEYTYDQGKWIVYTAFLDLQGSPALFSDLIAAIEREPGTWLTVKALNFADYLRPESDRYFFGQRMPKNDFDLAYGIRLTGWRDGFFSVAAAVSTHPMLRWFSFVHVVWLAANVGALLACTWLALRHKQRHFRMAAAILLLPASYYFSYLLALTASDFRFMYPATLLMQVLTLTFIVLFVPRALRRLSHSWRSAGRGLRHKGFPAPPS